MKLMRLAPVTLTLLAILGCKSNTEKHGTAVTNEVAATKPADPATLGSISGTIHLTGKAPQRIKIDMSQDPACTFAPDNLTEQVIADKGNLSNVFVYIKSAPAYQPAASALTASIDQKGCRFVPHVVAVMQGGSVLFSNSDPTMHNVHTMPVQVGNRSVDVSQGPGAKPEAMKFTSAENMVPVRCNNHPWMNAFVNVSPTAYFAVSGTDGSFKIPDVPEGNYTLVFVHEKLGTHEMPISVKAHQTSQADSSFTAQ